jgi:hypothetical protein
MTAVMVELLPGPVATVLADTPAGLPKTLDDIDTIEIIGDMGEFSEHMMCSCSDSDDSPYQ